MFQIQQDLKTEEQVTIKLQIKKLKQIMTEIEKLEKKLQKKKLKKIEFKKK